jgi:carbon monoxide dehydrogenase subunit G
MKLENSFDVAARTEAAWDLLMDVPRVVPCMPGAELVETVDDTTWKARMRVKLGPIQLSFLADITRESADESSRVVTLRASAREERGRGAARATIESSLAEEGDGGTRIGVVTDLTLTGAAAQYARGMVQGVAAQLLTQFAACLERELATEQTSGGDGAGTDATASSAPPPPPSRPVPEAKPISGLSLGFRALWQSFVRLFRRS